MATTEYTEEGLPKATIERRLEALYKIVSDDRDDAQATMKQLIEIAQIQKDTLTDLKGVCEKLLTEQERISSLYDGLDERLTALEATVRDLTHVVNNLQHPF